MKKNLWIIPMILFLGMSTSYYLGCSKTDSPYGVYAPHGLDVPSPTPLPLTGAIVVNVTDGSSVVSNLTVMALSPGNATTLTATTNGGGQVAFNPNPIAPGVWTIQIPTQSNSLSNYALSQQFVTVGPGFTSATLNFNPGAFFAFLSPVSSSYPTSLQNNMPFTLSVTQTGFLSVPATYVFSGVSFPEVGGPATLDSSVTQASVTFQVPACSLVEPVFKTVLYRTGGTASQLLSTSNSVTIERGYPITITSLVHSENLNCQTNVYKGVTEIYSPNINDVWEINTSGGCGGAPFHIHIDFSSTNDSSSSTPSSEDFTLLSNTPYTFNWSPTHTSPVNFAWTVTDESDSKNTWSGSFVWDPHFGSGGSCSCSNPYTFYGFTGCESNISISTFNNIVLSP